MYTYNTYSLRRCLCERESVCCPREPNKNNIYIYINDATIRHHM